MIQFKKLIFTCPCLYASLSVSKETCRRSYAQTFIKYNTNKTKIDSLGWFLFVSTIPSL